MKLIWTNRIALNDEGVDRIKRVAGIYRLMHYDANRKKYLVHYVGQAKDLRDRLSKHLPTTEENRCCKEKLKNHHCYFRAAAITRQTDRDGAEVALYKRYRPSCPERLPDVNPIDINYI